MKRFTIDCDFNGVVAPFALYVGQPVPGVHPLKHQAAWLSQERGGSIPQQVMEDFQKLLDISRENGVSFEELCEYALGGDKGSGDPPPAEPESGGSAPEAGDGSA